MSTPNKYCLSEHDRNLWYNNVVKPLFLDGKQKNSIPTFVLLTGQPGAGKTTASAKYAQMLTSEPVKFSGDEIRILLPYAGEVLHENPTEYPYITKIDMSWARQKLVKDTFKNGYNLQMDCILSNPNDWRMDTLIQAKKFGYKVDCIALGVHRYLSEVSMFTRREEQINSFGVGFPVTMAPHDIAYELLPEVVSKMYSEKIADKVSVYNRIFENYYDTDKEDAPSPQGIMKAIIKSRQDYLEASHLKYIQTQWETIYENMQKRKAPADQLKEVLSHYIAFRKNSGLYLVDKYPIITKAPTFNKQR